MTIFITTLAILAILLAGVVENKHSPTIDAEPFDSSKNTNVQNIIQATGCSYSEASTVFDDIQSSLNSPFRVSSTSYEAQKDSKTILIEDNKGNSYRVTMDKKQSVKSIQDTNTNLYLHIEQKQ